MHDDAPHEPSADRRPWLTWPRLRLILAAVAVSCIFLYLQYAKAVEQQADKLMQAGRFAAEEAELRPALRLNGVHLPLLTRYLRVLGHQHKLGQALDVYHRYSTRNHRDLTEVFDTLLVAALTDPDTSVAGTAARACARLNRQNVEEQMAALARALDTARTPARAAGKSDVPAPDWSELVALTRSPDPGARAEALISLSQADRDQALPFARAALSDTSVRVKVAAFAAIVNYHTPPGATQTR